MNKMNLHADLDFATLSIHGDRCIEDSPDVAPPIHLSTTYFTGNKDQLTYSRAHTITRTRLEKLLGDLEGNGHAITYPTGMATVTALLTYIKPRVIYIARGGYFGVHNSIAQWKKLVESYHPPPRANNNNNNSITNGDQSESDSVFRVVDLDNGDLEKAAAAAAAAEQQDTNGHHHYDHKSLESSGRPLIWLETPKNPTSTLQDIEYYSKLAKAIGGVVAVDSTFATPILCKPFDFGADFVVHSSSKYLSGHSDLTCGVIVTRSEEIAVAMREERNVMGNVLGNLETWLMLRSLRTLALRVNQHSATAMQVAQWLADRMETLGAASHLTKVWYPSLTKKASSSTAGAESDADASYGHHDRHRTQYELFQKQMGGKGPGVLSIELDTVENTFRFQKALKLFTDATSLGGYESLIDYRYRWDNTVSPTLLRVSIGLESAQDLIADMERAFQSLDD